MSKRTTKPLPDAQATFRVRETQSFAASVISMIFGPFAESQPRLWTSRTFLLLVVKVYERLVIDNEQFTPKDFQEIARTLVEITKADVLQGRRGTLGAVGNKLDAESAEALADNLKQIVRGIYGTNLHAASHGRGKEDSSRLLE